ncbi:serine O-acetyltransferase [Pseudoroseicyclus sp. CXY001]|uniref:serine O-acetyltransferase n=1 Tax=Pseudoroseicyclus sp. CXY001 TaxID=3242492 RepID=UPI00358DA605
MRFAEDLRAVRALARAHGPATLFDLSLVYLALFRLGSGLYRRHRIFAPVRLFEKLLELVFGIHLPFTADIGGGLVIFHYHGIIINGGARLGRSCRLHARICIGNRFPGDGAPVLGDGVTVGTGAAILGPVEIPAGTRIPANAVVTPRSLAAFIPARNGGDHGPDQGERRHRAHGGL